MEYKSLGLELKDMDREKRTAVIAHSVYNDIDRTGDIARKGMFTKSWKESKADISFYLNHNDEQSPGTVTDVFEDEQKAYTAVKLGTHTLGNDTLIMMDEGVAKKASFGYIPEKKNWLTIKGQKVRELKEVLHLETSVLTKLPAHAKAGVVSVVKSFGGIEFKTLSDKEQEFLIYLATKTQATLEELIAFSGSLDSKSDLYTSIIWMIREQCSTLGDLRSNLRYNTKAFGELKEHAIVMEKFIRNTSASDECIKSISDDYEEIKSLISKYDTDSTLLITEPDSSKNDRELVEQIKSINALFKKN